VSIELARELYEDLADHLRTRGRRAHRAWDVNQANEDSLTGAAFAEFHTSRTRRVVANGQEYAWRVRAYKFGSGGLSSQERRTGADGIIEIEVLHHSTGNVEHKSLLVQAKKEWTGTDSRLVQQVERMESLVPGSSAAIDYGPRGYSGVSGHDILQSHGNRRLLSDRQISPLGDFLADQFLTCHVGVQGLFYDPRRKQLHLPRQPNAPDAIRFMIPERLRIEIEETPLS